MIECTLGVGEDLEMEVLDEVEWDQFFVWGDRGDESEERIKGL